MPKISNERLAELAEIIHYDEKENAGILANDGSMFLASDLIADLREAREQLSKFRPIVEGCADADCAENNSDKTPDCGECQSCLARIALTEKDAAPKGDRP